MDDHTRNSETGREQPNEAGWSAQPPFGGQQPQQPPFYGQQEPGPHQAPPPPPPGYGYGRQDGGRPPYGQPPYRQYPPYVRPYTDNSRIYSILSYIGILWLVGLIVDRGNPRVRFHVNQGIILQIALSFAQGIFTNIVNVIFAQNYTGAWTISPLGHAINGLVSLAVGLINLAFIIIGVVHAAQDREEPLPIIGTLFTILK